MKKIIPILLILLLAGCAMPDLSAIPFLQSPTPLPTRPSNTPVPTVTLISDGWTDTPDPFATSTLGATNTPPSGTPLATNTRTPTSTITPRSTITLEPVDPNLFTPSISIFGVATKSTTQLVWGYNCDGARSIQFTVQLIAPVKRLKYVTLWYRLQDKYSGRHTEWGGGAIMSDNDRGTYFYTIDLDQIADYMNYYDAWLQYQFVASNIYLNRLGSSIVDRTSVSLTHCSVFKP
jgi:hypothetical protein